MKEPDVDSTRYVLYFDETLRGLSVGAPVSLLGLPAGEVTGIGLELDRKTARLRGRVEIVTFPERVVARLAGQEAALVRDPQYRHTVIRRLVEERGLRAQLRSGSLVTGATGCPTTPSGPTSPGRWPASTRPSGARPTP
jgi:paraquat-inducible protein B